MPKLKKLVKKLNQQVEEIGGTISCGYLTTDPKHIISLDFCLGQGQPTEYNCVASIDLMQTPVDDDTNFSVDCYNDAFNYTKQTFRQAKALQLLAVKFAFKLMKYTNSYNYQEQNATWDKLSRLIPRRTLISEKALTDN